MFNIVLQDIIANKFLERLDMKFQVIFLFISSLFETLGSFSYSWMCFSILHVCQVVTFWEGEIVDTKNYTFFTGKWEATYVPFFITKPFIEL